MAVIKAVSSKAGIGHAIDYVTKKEKTEEKLVSGLHCEPETVKEEMQATKELWGKTDGRTYKHYVQSYHEDEEITPEQAHKNAVELAEHTKAWKGHEVLIATHIDKGKSVWTITYGCIQFAVWDYFIYLFVLWGDDYISWNDNADGNFCLNIMAEESV